MNRFVASRSPRATHRALIGLAFALPTAPALANVVVFDKFNQAGNSWAATTFSDVQLNGAGAAVERVVIGAGLGAPNTVPALPINEGGDKEGRFFESGGVFSSAFALTDPLPQNELTDVSIDGYVAFGFTSGTGSRSAAFLVRANDAAGAIEGYIAVLTHDVANTGTLSIGRVRNGVLTAADTFITSQSFPMTTTVENYHLHFTANGPELIARLNRVEIVGGDVIETRIDLLPDAGTQDTMVAIDAELQTGRVGMRAFTRNTNSVFFDDVDIVEHGSDNMVTNEGEALGTTYGTPVGDVPGDIIFTEDGIPVRVFDFFFPGGGGAFGSASIQRTSEQHGFGRVMGVNNINIGYNFSSLGRAGRVTIEFYDQGGFENLVVNNSPTYIGEISAVPVNFAPGITATVETTSALGGVRGVLTLEGSIFNLRIGGQEFAIDDLCVAITCECDWNADFVLNSQDFFDFLTDFFNQNADYNLNGVTDSQDYFDFLTCFLAGCV